MRFLTLLLFLTTLGAVAQSKFETIEDDFEDFAEPTREQIYAHINKSTFITGEYIWFKVYVLSRDTKDLSSNTTNIYCALFDKDNVIASKKMIMGINGVANGQIKTDSTFASGEYTFKVYTNWSKNFKDEYVHYEAKLKIINYEEKNFDKPLKTETAIDVQILPESGHLLANTNNKVGIIAKDSLGHAVGDLRVTLYENEILISEVTLNDRGVNVFNLLPKLDVTYTAKYNYADSDYYVNFPSIKKKGVLLHVNNINEELKLQIKTNDATLEDIKRKLFKVTFHNSVELKGYEFNFQDNLTQQFKLSKKDLFSGINIFTLFNSDGKAIAERMIFNYDGLDISNIENPVIDKQRDSLEIKLPIKNLGSTEFHSLSASVLPSITKSYNHHNNLISSVLLSPYLKGAIENADYYFYDIDENKKIALDCLLLTQGWSIYDWSTIFNKVPEMSEEFEYGINYRLSSNYGKDETFLVYPNINTKSEILDIPSKKSIEKVGFFPLDDEKLRIGKRERNNTIGKSNLVVNFYPNKIPNLNTLEKSISVFSANQLTNQTGYESIINLDKVQKLDEVKIIKTKGYTRIEKIQNKTIGKIFDFDEKMKRTYKSFEQFISVHGYRVQISKNPKDPLSAVNIYTIEARVPLTPNNKTPIIFIDDVLLSDFEIFRDFPMDIVDYIEVNKGGIGEGLRGGAGVIRIHTDPHKGSVFKSKKTFTEYKIPLSYEKSKKYYSPKFKSTRSLFFKEYGAIDWMPNLNVKDGFIIFKIPTQEYPIKIFMEGIINSKSLVSEIIEVD